jgi:RND family efflux transporter MFP subunit
LERVHFEEGGAVEAGELLYEIERAPYEATLEAAQAELARAEAAVAEAKFELDRVVRLRERDVASEQELVAAQAKYDGAVAVQQAAAAAVTQAELDLGYTRITAPIAGRINATRVDAGNLVGDGERTLLTTIVPWDPIYVFFSVGERAVLELRREAAETGQRRRDVVDVFLRLADGSDYPIPGKVDYVDNRVDPSTGTIGVRAVFENPDEVLIPGIFTRVLIPNPPREALLVPEVALQRDLDGYFLLTVNAENAVARRNVEVGEQVGNARVVTGGLAEDARVIINGLQRARPGATVAPEPATFEPVGIGPAPVSPEEAAAEAAGDDTPGDAAPVDAAPETPAAGDA